MKKRILYTIPNVDTAGSGKALQYVARGVAKAGWEVHMAMQHTKGKLAAELMSEFHIHEVDYITPMRPLHRLFQGAWRVSRTFKKIAPQLIHSFNYMAEYSEGMAAKFAGIPWLFTKKNMSWKGLSYNQWKLRSALARKIIIQNTDMQKEFYPQSKKTELIPRGVDHAYYSHSKSLKHQISERIPPPGKRVILTVANLVPVKGVEILISAFAKIKEQCPEWELWVVGDTTLQSDYTAKLHSMIQETALQDSIRLSGKQHDIRPYLGSAELFVLPTLDKGRKEGSPLATLEAMAAGLVVLGSDIPGIRDQLQSKAEHLFTPGKPDVLAAKLLPFMQQTPEQNALLGKQFEELALNRFSLEHEIEAHLEVYENLIRN